MSVPTRSKHSHSAIIRVGAASYTQVIKARDATQKTLERFGKMYISHAKTQSENSVAVELEV
eukprot:m.236739 g.236739  ORF g.236739 m.236739 type:complete len:62 (-) comp19353_c0_seq3:1370-1555(-)